LALINLEVHNFAKQQQMTSWPRPIGCLQGQPLRVRWSNSWCCLCTA